MSNQVILCHSANKILAGLLSGNSQYSPNVMYVEFQQGSTPVPALSLPEVDPADNHYYLDLRDNTLSNRDFLRIPIASITPYTAPASTDISLFFNGICVGTEGVGGKSTAGSVIYGIAIANAPTYGLSIDDLTTDLIWARGYFAPENQMPFSTVAQTSITFKLNLTK